MTNDFCSKQKENSCITQFEASLFLDDEVLSSLAAGRPLGVAVSGGADSMALLTALCHRFSASRLHVITVNHNIRPRAESAGDADFVVQYCGALGIPCRVIELETGLVSETAASRGRGTEEAARFLRYEAFERFVQDEHLAALALAHNQNDQLETLVMRFLQGSSVGAGICYRRGLFIRPLLYVERSAIEQYLRVQGISWRTDATNADTRYLRNRIRHTVLPAFDKGFPGWRGAVLAGAEKTLADTEALDELSSQLVWKKEREACVSMAASEFYREPPAVRRRLLYRAFTALGVETRFPYSAVRQLCNEERGTESCADSLLFELHGITCVIKNQTLFIKKTQKKATETGFIGILASENDSFSTAGYTYGISRAVVPDSTVLLQKSAGLLDRVLFQVELPVCIRSAQSADEVCAADGTARSVHGLFSAWHIPQEERRRIPVVQELKRAGQPIVAVLGSVAGASDWIEKERKL